MSTLSHGIASASVLAIGRSARAPPRVAGAGDPDPRQPRLQGGQARAGAEATRRVRRGAEAAAAARTAEAGRRRRPRRQKDERSPKERVAGANAAARIEPGQGRLHQRHPGLSLHQGRALPALRRRQPGHRHRAGAGREARLGVGRRHGALGGRRHHQRRGQGRTASTSWSSRSAPTSRPTSSSPPTGAPIIWRCGPRNRPTWRRCRGPIRRPS